MLLSLLLLLLPPPMPKKERKQRAHIDKQQYKTLCVQAGRPRDLGAKERGELDRDPMREEAAWIMIHALYCIGSDLI